MTRSSLTVASQFVAGLIIVGTMSGCGSKTNDRLLSIETGVGEFQRVSQEKIVTQERQISELNEEVAQLTRRLQELNTQLQTQSASLKEVSDYLQQYDSTWTTFTRLQGDYDNELQRIKDQQLASTNSLTEARREIDTAVRTVASDLAATRNDLRQRIDRTNGDVFSLREQSKEKLDDMTAALHSFGDGLQEILQLQRAQFQGMAETYTRSLSDIEQFLPEAMLGNLNTPELLVSPNPDVTRPAPPQSE